MKILLTLIMCSSVEASCMPPYQWPATFNNTYDCLQFGYKESQKKIESLGRKEVNKYGVFIKFICSEKSYKLKEEENA